MTVVMSTAGCAAVVGGGYNVQTPDEAKVAIGMTPEQVLQVLGPPSRKAAYRNQPGPTFTYRVIGQREMVFDVDFDADGKVMSKSERMEPMGGGGHMGHMGRGGR